MQKITIIFLSLFLLLSCQNSADTKDAAIKHSDVKLGEVQEPVVAGKFYPGSAAELKNMVDSFLGQTTVEPVKGELMAIIVPHAGYQYSGRVAAYGFKQLLGRQYDYVVVLSPSHTKNFEGAATRLVKNFETPLGKIPVATDIVEKMIKKYEWIVDDPVVYEREHSLEVELPFLQSTLQNFKLIPLVVGTHDLGIIQNIAGSLNEELSDKKVLYVVSTDMSHYHPYDRAVKMDKETIRLLTEEKFDDFIKRISDGTCELCGFAPVMTIMALYNMSGGGQIKLLKYENSGDVVGEKSRVVGYSALAVERGFNLTARQKEELRALVKKTLADHLAGKSIEPVKLADPYLMKNGAAFVTLKKNGQLRGCIGHIIAMEPLARSIQQNTVAAASHDPRFPPVRTEELKDISIEISVLTPPQPVYDKNIVEVGRDGLIIESGGRRGVLLPQVPGEFGWNRGQFLAEICEKAGLSPDAIDKPETKLYRFQALVF